MSSARSRPAGRSSASIHRAPRRRRNTRRSAPERRAQAAPEARSDHHELTGGAVAVKWPDDHISPIPRGVALAAVMIAFIARFIGLWMIAGALVALVIDGTKTIAASTLT